MQGSRAEFATPHRSSRPPHVRCRGWAGRMSSAHGANALTTPMLAVCANRFRLVHFKNIIYKPINSLQLYRVETHKPATATLINLHRLIPTCLPSPPASRRQPPRRREPSKNSFNPVTKKSPLTLPPQLAPNSLLPRAAWFVPPARRKRSWSTTTWNLQKS